jgi:hypothetical protein
MDKVPPRKKGKQEDKDELVLTPGGWRPKSKTHFIEPGYHIDSEGGRLKIIHTATGKVTADLGEIPKAESEKPKKSRSGAGTQRKKKKQTKKK